VTETQQKKPRVSVVIPAYNLCHFLPDALCSVFAQTVVPHEVIVVDDGSTDDTQRVLEPFPRPRLCAASKECGRGGGSQSWRRARDGRCLAFLDADDIWLVRKLEHQLACLEQNPNAGLVHCGP
jgi:glycosyltransferase involved in cell wall biosynthesis